MKKLLMLVLIAMSLVLIAGCSDDDDNGGGGNGVSIDDLLPATTANYDVQTLEVQDGAGDRLATMTDCTDSITLSVTAGSPTYTMKLANMTACDTRPFSGSSLAKFSISGGSVTIGGTTTITNNLQLFASNPDTTYLEIGDTSFEAYEELSNGNTVVIYGTLIP